MSFVGFIYDLVVIIGKFGNQVISFVIRVIGSIKVFVEFEEFVRDVYSFFKFCEGSLLLVSFVVLYWFYLDKKIEFNE